MIKAILGMLIFKMNIYIIIAILCKCVLCQCKVIKVLLGYMLGTAMINYDRKAWGLGLSTYWLYELLFLKVQLPHL